MGNGLIPISFKLHMTINNFYLNVTVNHYWVFNNF